MASDSDSKSVDQAPVLIREGRDEMNLVEWPFATLQFEARKGAVEEKTWLIPHPTLPGETLTAMIRRAGDPELGLPTPIDTRVYLILVEVTREAGWPKTVYFSPYDLIRRLGWPPNKKHYEMLLQSLRRLMAVTNTLRYCFWDNKQKKLREEVAYHILENYSWDPGKRGRRAQSELPLCSFTWDKVIYESMRAGYVRKLDLDFYLSIKLPIAQLLYRYLEKKRWTKSGKAKTVYFENLRNLCYKHIMLTDTAHVSTMKRTLAPSHKELIERGYLASVTYAKIPHQKNERVIYRFGARILPAENPHPTPGPDAPADHAKWLERGTAALQKLKADDHELWEELRDAAVDALDEFRQERYRKDPNSPLQERLLIEDMIALGEKSYPEFFS